MTQRARRPVPQESDLYEPVKHFLEEQGYSVKGEVGACDVVAVAADGRMVVVELKSRLNLELILQAVDRLRVSENVFLGVPADSAVLRRQRRRLQGLLRRLGLGLLSVRLTGRYAGVRVLLEPGPYRPRQSEYRRGRLLREFNDREGDPNAGGSPRNRRIVTAFRQRAMRVANYLLENGPTRAAVVAEALSIGGARDLMYRDVYGWFDRVDRGVYALSEQGRLALLSDAQPD